MKISVSRGLVELKLLNDRITKEITGSDFVSAYIGKNDTTLNGMSKSDVEKNIKSVYQSITDLIVRRNTIKQVIVLSNAQTRVTIAKLSYTVAEAIERKNSIEYDEQLLARMQGSFAVIMGHIENRNANVKNDLDLLLGKMAESDNQNIRQTSETYHDMNDAKILDPLKIEDKIKKLEDEIYNFKLEVDVVLSESNAITMIEV